MLFLFLNIDIFLKMSVEHSGGKHRMKTKETFDSRKLFGLFDSRKSFRMFQLIIRMSEKYLNRRIL